MGNRVDGCSEPPGHADGGAGCQHILPDVGCYAPAGSSMGSDCSRSFGSVCSRSFSCRYPPQDLLPVSQEVNVDIVESLSSQGLDFDIGSPIKPRAVLDTSPQQNSSGKVVRSLFQECSAHPCRQISRSTRARGSRGSENVPPSNCGDVNCDSPEEDVKVRTNMPGPSGSIDADVTHNGNDIFGIGRSNRGSREWHGPGILTWPDGRRYVGQFNQGLFHGDAIMEWPDGRRYVGQYKNNKKHGEGEFLWPDGRRYTGQWKGGLRHGRGQYKNSKGEARVGRWLQDRPLYWEADKAEKAEVPQAVPESAEAWPDTWPQMASKAVHAFDGSSELEQRQSRSPSALGGA